MVFERRFTSPRLRKSRRRKILVTTGIDLALVVAVIVLASQVLSIPSLLVEDINIIGASSVSSRSVKVSVQDILEEKYLYIFPKKNFLILPRKEIKNYLLSEFKRVDEVDLDGDGLSKVSVIIHEREPVAKWCRNVEMNIVSESDTVEEVVREECFFADKTGFIFSPSEDLIGEDLIKLFGPLSKNVGSEKSPIGLFYLSGESFGELISAFESFSELGLPVDSAERKNSSFEAYLADGGRVIFNDDENFSDVVENLRAALSSSDFEKDAEGNLPQIDYIDLRFGNKVFFKTI